MQNVRILRFLNNKKVSGYKMNEVFLIGNIVTNIDFDFMINSKNMSISRFVIKTLDNQIIKLHSYNNLADFAYSKLKENDEVFVYGKLHQDYIQCYYMKKLL